MLRRSIVLFFGLVMVAAGSTAMISRPEGSPDPAPSMRGALERLPLSFIENQGQVDSRAHYYLQGAGASVYFTPRGVGLSLGIGGERQPPTELALEFPGAESVTPSPGGKAPGVVSYFKGPSSNWNTGIPTYSRVAYRELWPGIDVVYSGTASRLKYRFVVEPGADPSPIGMTWEGSSGLSVNDRGQLEVATGSGTVVDDTPYSYQVSGGRRVEVPTTYDLGSGRHVGFRLGAYDPTLPLVIDPALLIYAGYIGGSGSDQGTGIAVDGSGNAYVTGTTTSAQTTFPDGDDDANDMFPVPGPDQIHNGSEDAFVAKINAAGTALVYAGYIGGSGVDGGGGIAVDGSGNAYITGSTGSTQTTFPDGDPDADDLFPVPGFDQTFNGNTDAFVAKINAAGTALVYATYIGGSGFDGGGGIAVDGSGNAYIAGSTNSTQTTFPDGDPDANDAFPVPGPDQTHNGSEDAFVAKVNPAGTALIYAGYIGGSGGETGGIAVDSSGNAYVIGETSSDQTTFPDGDPNADDLFPVPGPDQTYNGGFDAFVAKVNPGGTALVHAGYIGGSGSETGTGIAVDGSGNVSVTGYTASDQTTFPDGDPNADDQFPVPGPDQTHNGGNDAFVAKVNAAGTALVYAGYIGGSENDFGNGIAVDSSGNAYVAGETGSDQTTFPDGDPDANDAFTVPGPDQTYNGSTDGFVAKIDSAGTALVYAGYIGGSGNDFNNRIAVDSSGNAYVVGETLSDQTTFPDGDPNGDDLLPVPGPDQSHNGVNDAFVAKIEPFPLPPGPPGPPAPGPAPPSATCKGQAATVVGTAGNDRLTGTSGADVVASLGGNDTVKTLGGNDLVCAGDGNDSVNGGGGKDQLNGEAGKDKLKGGGGKDKLNGGSSKDTCTGGSGKDKAPKCEVEKSI